jgi:hypothetical protein
MHFSPPHPAFWAAAVINLAMPCIRFSEGVDAVKDLTEEEILNKSDDLLHSAEKSVKTDITKQFHSVSTRPFPANHALVCPSPFSMKLQGTGFGRETRPTKWLCSKQHMFFWLSTCTHSHHPRDQSGIFPRSLVPPLVPPRAQYGHHMWNLN